jgi:hypothetical protein
MALVRRLLDWRAERVPRLDLERMLEASKGAKQAGQSLVKRGKGGGMDPDAPQSPLNQSCQTFPIPQFLPSVAGLLTIPWRLPPSQPDRPDPC